MRVCVCVFVRVRVPACARVDVYVSLALPLTSRAYFGYIYNVYTISDRIGKFLRACQIGKMPRDIPFRWTSVWRRMAEVIRKL